VRGAIVPAAGQGTRLRPLSLGIAKELLPLGRYPTLVATLLEAAAAELGELCVVTAPEKEGLQRFLERFELVRDLKLLARVTLQPSPLGVLDAVARGLAELAPPCAVLFPDLVHLPDQTALKRLVAAHAACGAAVFGLRLAVPGEATISAAAVRLHEPLTSPGELLAAQKSGRPLRIASVGPATFAAGELLTTFGQIHTDALGEAIEARCRPAATSPLEDRHFLAALDDLARTGGLYGVLLAGEILDLGTLPGYLDAATRFISGTARLRGLP
jgi:UTP-glucose-1-phosphate uridylyltransferase